MSRVSLKRPYVFSHYACGAPLWFLALFVAFLVSSCGTDSVDDAIGPHPIFNDFAYEVTKDGVHFGSIYFASREVEAFDLVVKLFEDLEPIEYRLSYDDAYAVQRIVREKRVRTDLIFLNNFELSDERDRDFGKYLGDQIFCFPHSSDRFYQSDGVSRVRIVFKVEGAGVFVRYTRNCSKNGAERAAAYVREVLENADR